MPRPELILRLGRARQQLAGIQAAVGDDNIDPALALKLVRRQRGAEMLGRRALRQLEQLERLRNALGGAGELELKETAPGVFSLPANARVPRPPRLLQELEQLRRVKKQVREAFDLAGKVLR